MDDKEKKLEQLFWNIALPGVAQLLNGKYIKGVLFIVLEFLINVQANFNTVILLSFQGEINQAIEQTNYQWLMFSPAVKITPCNLLLFTLFGAYSRTCHTFPIVE
ncbi:hypothetical protein [Paenibacillus sp. SYP-B3998]|uniref:hypothetical protein n=1 Tax=Paenibacillus sp. SYP-B3998 TaxID=2678564 RepID=UPI0019677D38